MEQQDLLTGGPAEERVRETCRRWEIDPSRVTGAEVRITDGEVQQITLEFSDGTALEALPA